MFSSVESCRTKRANNRLVASSIMAIRYSFSPRPSNQSCSLVSHCTSSPNRLRRGRQTCTCWIFSFFARHSLPRIIHVRTVSLLASPVRRLSAKSVDHRLVAALLQGIQQPLHLPRAQTQLFGSLPLRNQFLLGFLLRHQPVTIGLGHQWLSFLHPPSLGLSTGHFYFAQR